MMAKHFKVKIRKIDHPLYNTWRNMMARCYNENNTNYHNYGGRGIKVCDRWHDFFAFALDVGKRPKKLTLERIDNDKGYTPNNCCWTTMKQQSANRRRNKTGQGKYYCFHKATSKWMVKTRKKYHGLFETEMEAKEYVEKNIKHKTE